MRFATWLAPVAVLAGCNEELIVGVAPVGDFGIPRDLAASVAADGGEADFGDPGGPDLWGDPCFDGERNGDETDVDCGGMRCAPCEDGKKCGHNYDCRSARCVAGACGPRVTCQDGVRNGMETDVDCGGPACPYCGVGKRCRSDGDCVRAICVAGTCVPPTPRALDLAMPVTLEFGTFRDIATADFNADGRADLVAVNIDRGEVTVLLGLGGGNF